MAQVPDPNNLRRQARKQGLTNLPVGLRSVRGSFDLNRARRTNQQAQSIQGISRELPTFQQLERLRREREQQRQGINRELPGFEAVDRRARAETPATNQTASRVPDVQELEREFRRAAEGKSISNTFASKRVAHELGESQLPTPLCNVDWMYQSVDRSTMQYTITSLSYETVSVTANRYYADNSIAFCYDALACSNQNPNGYIYISDMCESTEFTFVPSVSNPYLAIYSLGQPGTPVTLTASADLDVVCTDINPSGCGLTPNPLVKTASNAFRGEEGFGIIQFTGVLSSITIGPAADSLCEHYSNYAWGIGGCESTPTP